MLFQCVDPSTLMLWTGLCLVSKELTKTALDRVAPQRSPLRRKPRTLRCRQQRSRRQTQAGNPTYQKLTSRKWQGRRRKAPTLPKPTA